MVTDNNLNNQRPLKKGLFFKKGLGQYLLVDDSPLNQIVQIAAPDKEDAVLEIGAGTGLLTERLLVSGCTLIAVEIDPRFCRLLEERFRGKFPHLEIISQDILEIQLRALKERCRLSSDVTFTVVGNLPYHLTTPILSHLFSQRQEITRIIITIQKEMAERLVAAPGSRGVGAITYFVQFYSQVRLCFSISKNCFRPMPKVDSACVQLIIKKELPSVVSEKALFFLIKTCFQQRRKKILNALRPLAEPGRIRDLLKQAAIASDKRPENIMLEEYIKLTDLFCREGVLRLDGQGS